MSEATTKPSAVQAIESCKADLPPMFVIRAAWDGRCQGYCRITSECQGKVRVVRVCGWGWFAYCEMAVATDLERGFDLFDEHDEPMKGVT